MSDAPIVSAYDLYSSNENLETAGAWVDIGPMRFKVTRAGGQNDVFAKAAAKKFKPFQAAINAGTMPTELSRDLLVSLYVDHIVKDWQNVYGRDKQPLVYSKEACKQLLTDLPDLLFAIQNAAMELSNFQQEQREAASGN